MSSPATTEFHQIPKVMDQRWYFDPMRRYTLHEHWNKLPQTTGEVYPADAVLSTFTQAELLAYTRANKDWLLSGTGAAAASATFAAGGGLTITSGATAADETIVSPLILNSVQQSAWGGTAWLPAKELRFRAMLDLGSVAEFSGYVKLGLTASLSNTTDNDQVGIRWLSTSAGVPIPFTSIGGTDATITPLWTFTAVPGTMWEFAIELDAQRYPTFYINRQKWARGSTPLTATLTGGYGPSGVGLGPVFGVITSDTPTASAMTIKSTVLSRLH